MLRASVVIDYQNVHLTARDVFDPHGDSHNSLVHPMLFPSWRFGCVTHGNVQVTRLPS